MRLELRDVPGSLLRALEPIALHGGNIVNIVHSRSGREIVEVEIGFTVKDQEDLNQIRRDLQKNSIRYSEITLEGKKYYSKKSVSAIMVGHVIDEDIRDTIDKINEVGLVSSIDVIMPSPEEKSSVMMNIEVDNSRLSKLNEVLKKTCDKKKFTLIRSL